METPNNYPDEAHSLTNWCASSGLLFVYVHRKKQVAAVDELANVPCEKELFQNVYIQLCLPWQAFKAETSWGLTLLVAYFAHVIDAQITVW